MIQTIIGKKIEQTQRFLEDGMRVPVTIIAVPKTSVFQVKTVEKDGYSAVQIGFGAKKRPTKALLGHSRKASISTAPLVVKEVKLVDEEAVPAVGEAIALPDVLKPGDIIKVTGTGKGKGFQGGVRRHGFKGGPRTHGQSDRERAPGSIGQTTTPGRVYKGKRMAGHMGTTQVSVTNLVVIEVTGDAVFVKGLVPGVLKSTVYIEKMGELKKPLAFYQDPSIIKDKEETEGTKGTEEREERKGDKDEEKKEESVEVITEAAKSVEEPKTEEVKAEVAAPSAEETKKDADQGEKAAKEEKSS